MAFKMSPIGRNKDPYATMAKRGYIAPTKQNKTDEEMQNNANLDAENNMASTGEPIVTYSDPVITYGEDEKGKYKQTDRDKITTNMFEGKGTDRDAWNENRKGVQDRYSSFEEFSKAAQAYRDKMTKTVDHESNKEYFPDTDDSSNKKNSNIPRDLRGDDMKEYEVYNAVKRQVWDPEKNRYVTVGDGMVDAQYRDNLNKAEIKEKVNTGDKNITINSLTPEFDRLSKDDQQTIQNKIIQENVNKGDLSDPYTLAEKEYNEKNSPNPQLSATRQLMNKYMPNKSMAKQETKTTYISDVETELPGVEGWKENKERYENAKRLKSHLEDSGTGDKANLDVDLAFRSMLPEVEITPTKQLRGHSIATQCAKSEGGDGCVKKVGSGWKVISNKTGKYWNATYDSKDKADAALKAYHAG